MRRFTIFFCLALIVAVALCEDTTQSTGKPADKSHSAEKDAKDHPHPPHDGAGKNHHDHEHDHTTTPSTAAP
uniref:Secreted protein n=1 Tax=Steinernema glaseri TaxID=37863 RepID=A0A1I7YT55_9BILA